MKNDHLMHQEDIIDNLVLQWQKERPKLDASAMLIVGRILYLGKLLENSAGRVLQPFKIHYTDLDVLATLRRSGKPYALTPTELMQSVLITSGAMTALLDRLTKLGLIERLSDTRDRRVKRAQLTKKGIKIIDKAIVARFSEAHNAIKILDEQEEKQLAQLLKKLMAQDLK